MKIKALGSLVDVKMSATNVAAMVEAQRGWEAEKSRRKERALFAVDRYVRASNKRNRKAALHAITQRITAEGSDCKLAALLDLIEHAPAEIFWLALIENWPSCDDTWHSQPRLLRAMNKNEQARTRRARA